MKNRIAMLPLVVLIVCLLGAVAAPSRAISPLATDKRDYLFVGMSGFSDAGPRPPNNVEWYQLDADGQLIDQRRLYRTDDAIWGVALDDRTREDGYLQLVMAVTRERVHDALLVSVPVDRYGLVGSQVPLTDKRRGGRFSDVAICAFAHDEPADLFAVWVSEQGDSSILRWDINKWGQINNERVVAEFPGQVVEAVTAGLQPRSLELVVQETAGCRLLRIELDASGQAGRPQDLGLIAEPSMGRVHGLSRDGGSLLAAVRRVNFEGDVAVVPEVEYQGEMTGPEVAALDEVQMSNVIRLEPTAEGYREAVPVDAVTPGRLWATAISRVPAFPETFVSPEVADVDRNSRHVIYIEGFTGQFFGIDELETRGFTLNKGWVESRKNGIIPPAHSFKLDELKQTGAIIFTDAPLWALTHKRILLLESYVRAGGTLVFCEGPMTGKPGGYAESTFAGLLPTDLGPAFGIVPLESPREVEPIGRVRYVKALGPVKEGARVLAEIDGHPLLVERQLGRGRVLQVAALPLGRSEDGQPDFWESDAWIKWLESWLSQP